MAVAKVFEWMGWDGWMVNGLLKASSVLKRGRNIPKISPLKLIGAKKEFPAVMSGCKPRPLCGGSSVPKAPSLPTSKAVYIAKNKPVIVFNIGLTSRVKCVRGEEG